MLENSTLAAVAGDPNLESLFRGFAEAHRRCFTELESVIRELQSQDRNTR
jgi:hypothetical protein